MVDDTGDDDRLKRPLGPTGETVRVNIIRLRTQLRRMGYTELSERLKDHGRRIPPLGLRRIENGARRVDADDLFALAVALGVSPVTLLTPDAGEGGEKVAATGVTEKCDVERLWNWVCAHEPIDPDVQTIEFWIAALPSWKKRQVMDNLNIKFVDAQFSGGGGLAGEVE